MKTRNTITFSTIQKPSLLKARESYFSLILVLEFHIISSCLGKAKVFSDNSNLTILVDNQSLHENAI